NSRVPRHSPRQRSVSKTYDSSKTTWASSSHHVYPFTAIVGQDEMKVALLLAAIDPHIGGVIVFGHRGTGKSTAVRALADLLPPLERVKGCLFGCDPGPRQYAPRRRQDAPRTGREAPRHDARRHDLCHDCAAHVASGSRLPREKAPVPVVDLPLGATEDR